MVLLFGQLFGHKVKPRVDFLGIDLPRQSITLIIKFIPDQVQARQCNRRAKGGIPFGWLKPKVDTFEYEFAHV